MSTLQPGSTLQNGKYEIQRVLGQGGFGITYLALQQGLNRIVAIKEFFIENFWRNRQTLWGGCTDANPKLLLNDI
ncbi:MAG: hypothetical protein MR505_02510 [Bacteroidales bacterium]|nr:hypothetical protein [Bacteroidales bacterium]